MPKLPTGTVTFLFTDIEGSTEILQRLGEAYREMQAAHDLILREAIAEAGGVEVSTEGDSFFCVFPAAGQAIIAAAAAQQALSRHRWPDDEQPVVRMGLHTGHAVLGGDNYLGIDVNRAARIASAAHGGQVLLSATTHALVQSALPSSVALRDLGEHRLKDLPEPEHLYQLVLPGLPADFPPLRTLFVANLPAQLTSFVGREREVAEAVRLLGESRLLTLTGPGGTGKTRLSIRAAEEVADQFPDGTYFVALASVTDPELVPSAIATVLDLSRLSGPPLERLRSFLSHRRMLLVLDNFEQVLAAGPMVSELIGAAPGLKVLVSSRAPLRVYGEQELAVPPLQLPDLADLPPLEALEGYEAVALFTARAKASRPDFELSEENRADVAEITARLDGLPLAIELAAARVKLLPPRAIRDRLGDRLALLGGGARDLPTRQQTLRDAIGWSYDLLDQPSRRLFERMAVFAGGAGLGQAEAVCGPPEEVGADLLDGLARLVDHSLLRLEEVHREPRFAMLETIRDFALERLGSGGEGPEIQRRHADAFLALAEEAEPHLTKVEQVRWLDLLETEHANLRAALNWGMEQRSAEFSQRLAASLWRFWQIRGHLDEARRRLDAALALEGEPHNRARALEASGGVFYWQGDAEGARGAYQESLDLLQQTGDRRAVANALYNLAFPYMSGSDFGRVEELLGESLAIYRELGDEAGVAKVLWGLGDSLGYAGRHQEARALLQESADMFRRLADPFGLGWALYVLAFVEMRLGELSDARTHLEESLKIFAGAGDLSGVTFGLHAFGVVEVAEGRFDRAVRLLGAVAKLRRTSGIPVDEMMGEGDYATASADLKALRERASPELLAEGERMTLDEAVAYALAREDALIDDGGERG